MGVGKHTTVVCRKTIHLCEIISHRQHSDKNIRFLYNKTKGSLANRNALKAYVFQDVCFLCSFTFTRFV